MKYLGDEKIVKRISQRPVEYIRCDICQRKISQGSQYFPVYTWHSDWRNDSYESDEHKDLCKECTKKYVADYIAHSKGTEKLKLSSKFLTQNEKYYDFYNNFYDNDAELVINDKFNR